MLNIKELGREQLKPIKLIAFDTDGVTVRRGTELKENRNEMYIKTHDIEGNIVRKLKELSNYYVIVFSSGRSLLYLSKMYEAVLDYNVLLQAENGLMNLMGSKITQSYVYPNYIYSDLLNLKKQIGNIRNKNICGFEPKQFIITVHCRDRVEEIEEIVPEGFYCLWNGEAYDIGLKGIDKGYGLSYICDRLNIKTDDCIAVGNGENDKPMLDMAGIGITTDRTIVRSDYYTNGELDLGGEEVINHILGVIR